MNWAAPRRPGRVSRDQTVVQVGENLRAMRTDYIGALKDDTFQTNQIPIPDLEALAQNIQYSWVTANSRQTFITWPRSVHNHRANAPGEASPQGRPVKRLISWKASPVSPRLQDRPNGSILTRHHTQSLSHEPRARLYYCHASRQKCPQRGTRKMAA
jgi:hypothetical protein